jgi:iron complex transport system permease protein
VFAAHGSELDILAQGDDVAQTLGVDAAMVRRRIYVGLTVVVGAVVALTGLIGFVGLVVPHLVRRQVGARHRPLVVLSAGWGAVLLVVADALCRGGFRLVGTELPVGVLTAFVGAPYFLWVLREKSG